MTNLTIVRNTSVMTLPVQQHNDKPVMSSIDLAKMCVGDAKDAHRHFMDKAKKVLGSTLANFCERETYGNNNTRTILLLPEREACLMAMSYSYELQAKVYDAWQALRNTNVQPQHAIPQTYGEALRLAAEQTIKVEHQEVIILEHKKQATINAPKVSAFDALIAQGRNVTFAEAAKIIGFEKCGRLKMCIQKKWLCLNGEAQQHGIKLGYFVVKAHAWGTTTYMTPKGVAHFGNLAHKRVPLLLTITKQQELLGESLSSKN